MEGERAQTIAAIRRALESSGHDEIVVAADSPDEVTFIRSCGREAARGLGWRVRTLATDIASGGTRVHVMVTEADPMHERLWDAKRQKAMRAAINQL